MEPENPFPVEDDDSQVIPNHRASAGIPFSEAPAPAQDRPGIFARKRTPAKATAPKKLPADVPNVPGQFIAELEEFYSFMGMMILPFDAELGMTLTESAPRCAKAWDDAAQRSPTIRRMLYGAGTGAVVFALIAAHAPIFMVALKNHTPIGAKFDPAAAMEKYLRDKAEAEAEQE